MSCPNFVHALAAYYLILPGEASSNLARFDAMRYGLRVLPDGIETPSAEEVMRATRDAGFGDEVKRRIILGTYALSSGYYDAYYGQAQKVRTLISRDFDRGLRARPTCWSRRPRRPRRSGSARSSTTRWRCTSTTSRPSRPTWPGVPGISVPERPGRRGRPARRRPDAGAGAGRRPALPGRCRARGGAAGSSGAARCWTRPLTAGQGAWPDDRRHRWSRSTRRSSATTRRWAWRSTSS